MMYSNVIVGITISWGSFVFSYANLTNVESLAVGAFDLVNCSFSVVSKCRNVVVGLWATRMF